MKTKTNYMVTGLKLLALNILAAVVAWIIALLLGLSLSSIVEMSTFGAFFLIIVIIALIIIVDGWLAQKVWGWN